VKHTNLELFENIEPYKLHRKNDPETSKQAARSVKLSKARAFVFSLIEKAGENGITIKEMLADNLHLSTSSISSRPNELEKLNLIFYKGDKRNNSRVIRHIKYKEEEKNKEETH